jgi:hypothetical protein
MAAPDSSPIHDLAALSVIERRRRTVRHPCCVRVTYAIIMQPALAPLPGTAQDISEGGLGMRVGIPLARGTLLTVKLHTACGRWFLSRQAQVRHVRPGPAGTWLVGLAFGERLMSADLDMVLTPTDHSPATS